MKCEINILLILCFKIIFTLRSVSHTFEEPVKKKGKITKVYLTEHLLYLITLYRVCTMVLKEKLMC